MGSAIKSAAKGVLNGVKWIIIVGGALFTIFVVVMVLSVSDSRERRHKQEAADLQKQREQFRADMQKYFGLEESDYTIVKEYCNQESIYTYLVFTCGGEEEYYYSEGFTDYKTEWFREDACAWFKEVIEKTEWFAGMETEVQKVSIGWNYLKKEENMLPLTCFEESADSFLAEVLADRENGRHQYRGFYMTCEMQINASEIPDSPKELLQLKNTVPFLRTLTVHCYRVNPETQEKVFVKSYEVRYERGEYVIYE